MNKEQKERDSMLKILEARSMMARSAAEINKKLGRLTPMEWLDVLGGTGGLISFYIDCGLERRK